jgi:hypothetical protein
LSRSLPRGARADYSSSVPPEASWLCEALRTKLVLGSCDRAPASRFGWRRRSLRPPRGGRSSVLRMTDRQATPRTPAPASGGHLNVAHAFTGSQQSAERILDSDSDRAMPANQSAGPRGRAAHAAATGPKARQRCQIIAPSASSNQPPLTLAWQRHSESGAAARAEAVVAVQAAHACRLARRSGHLTPPGCRTRSALCFEWKRRSHGTAPRLPLRRSSSR